jgi:hypothetical protein
MKNPKGGEEEVNNQITENDNTQSTLHLVSYSGTFMVLFGFIFLLQRHTIGLLPILKNSTFFDLFPLQDLIFTLTSIFIITKYLRIKTPYK